MVKLKITQTKEVQRKINDFKSVRAERVAQLQVKYSSDAALNHAVLIDPIISQINGFIDQVNAMAIPDSIKLVSEQVNDIGPGQPFKIIEVKNVNDLIIKME